MKQFSILCFFLMMGGVHSLAQKNRLVLPSGHLDKIIDISFTSDDLMMASASADQSVKIWSTVNGKLLQELNGHSGEVFHVSFFPGSKKMLTAARDRSFRVWNISTGEVLVEKMVENGIRALFLTKDGKKIIVVTLNTILIFDAESGKEISRIEDNVIGGSITSRLSPNEGFLVLGKEFNLSEPQVRVWDLAGKKNYPLELEGCPYGARQSFFFNDSIVINHCKGNYVFVSNFISGNTERIELEDEIVDMNFLPGKNLITATFKNSKIFAGTLKELSGGKMTSFKQEAYHQLVTGPSGKEVILLSGNEYGEFQNSFRYLIEEGSLSGRQEVAYSQVLTNLYHSNRGKFIAAATPGGKVILYNAVTGEYLFTFSNHLEGVNAMYCIKDDIILTGDGYGFVKKWETRSGRMTTARKFSEKWIEAIDFHPKDSLLAIGTGSGSIHITSLSDLSIQKTFGRENWSVTANAFNSEGTMIAAYLQNYDEGKHAVSVWDLATGKELFNKSGFFFKGSSPFIGNQLVIGMFNERSLNLFDLTTGGLLKKVKMDDFQNFHPSVDGTMLVAASLKGVIKWWNVKDLSPVSQVVKAGAQFTDALISPDNKVVVSNAYDGTVGIWDSRSGKSLGSVNLDYGYNRMKFIDNRQLLIEASEKIFRLDLDNMKLEQVATGTWLQQWQNQPWFPGMESVVTIKSGSSFSIHSLKKATAPTIFCNIDSLDYLTVLPDGYYLSTPNAAKLLHYVTPDMKVITFDQLDVKYNRPDKVLASLGKSDPGLVSSFQKAYVKRISRLGIDTTAFNEGYSVPEADFSNREMVSYEQKDELLQLKITGGDKEGNLGKFQVWVNETPLFGMKGIDLKNRSVRSFDTVLTIQLSAGLNVIETSLTNAPGIESYRMPLTVFYRPASAPKEKLYFAGIGVDKYREPNHDLNYSVKDIRDLAVNLKKKYGENIVIDTLFNEKVTLPNVMALRKKLSASGINDKVLLSFSGHGLLSNEFDYYLSTYDVNFSHPEKGGIPYQVLESLMDSIPSRKKLMLIDACHSGEVDKEEMAKYKKVEGKNLPGLKGGVVENMDSTSKLGMKNSFELMQELFANVGRSTGATIISAAAGTQLAQERGDLKNGVFTYSILEFLNLHPAAKISALREYVNKRVPELTGGLQVPTTRNETSQVDWDL